MSLSQQSLLRSIATSHDFQTNHEHCYATERFADDPAFARVITEFDAIGTVKSIFQRFPCGLPLLALFVDLPVMCLFGSLTFTPLKPFSTVSWRSCCQPGTRFSIFLWNIRLPIRRMPVSVQKQSTRTLWPKQFVKTMRELTRVTWSLNLGAYGCSWWVFELHRPLRQWQP